MYFQKISGSIPAGKHKEFEQAISIIRENLPPGCAGFEFSKDTEDRGLYFITTLWDNFDFMQAFNLSDTGFMMTGAYKTLGSLDENKRGLIIEIS